MLTTVDKFDDYHFKPSSCHICGSNRKAQPLIAQFKPAGSPTSLTCSREAHHKHSLQTNSFIQIRAVKKLSSIPFSHPRSRIKDTQNLYVPDTAGGPIFFLKNISADHVSSLSHMVLKILPLCLVRQIAYKETSTLHIFAICVSLFHHHFAFITAKIPTSSPYSAATATIPPIRATPFFMVLHASRTILSFVAISIPTSSAISSTCVGSISTATLLILIKSTAATSIVIKVSFGVSGTTFMVPAQLLILADKFIKRFVNFIVHVVCFASFRHCLLVLFSICNSFR